MYILSLVLVIISVNLTGDEYVLDLFVQGAALRALRAGLVGRRGGHQRAHVLAVRQPQRAALRAHRAEQLQTLQLHIHNTF